MAFPSRLFDIRSVFLKIQASGHRKLEAAPFSGLALDADPTTAGLDNYPAKMSAKCEPQIGIGLVAEFKQIRHARILLFSFLHVNKTDILSRNKSVSFPLGVLGALCGKISFSFCGYAAPPPDVFGTDGVAFANR
jgi:hypothetical protein